MLDLKSHLIMPDGSPYQTRVVEKNEKTGEEAVVSMAPVTLGDMLIRGLIAMAESDNARSDTEMLVTFKLGHKIGAGDGEVEFTPDETKLLLKRTRLVAQNPFVWGAIVKLLAPAMLSAEALEDALKADPAKPEAPYPPLRPALRAIGAPKIGEPSSGRG